ncbi:IclR family transcriptional regulator [Microbacterium sp.]|uniref:IclR family transcriptional regulator n=1 Tax=Microbacterium sp. TaxID=51671 RepID=UPI00333E50F3
MDGETSAVAAEAATPARADDLSDGAAKPVLGTSALLRSFSVLEVLADAARSMTLDELVEASGLPKATLTRIVATFARKGYLLVEDGDRLTLGPRLIHLGATASLQLHSWARPHLERLVDETGVTASIAVLDSDEVVYLGQVVSGHTLGTFAEVGRRVAPHSTAMGKALLGQLPDDKVRDTLLRTGMPQQTDRTITDLEAFMAQLTVVRRQSYAFDDGEQDVGVRCIAVPVLTAPRVLSMSLSAPESRMSISDAIGYLPALERTAAEFSAALRAR